jgi:hypothetical protein
MPVSSRALVEFVLLGPSHDRRQLQDSPILGDVWIAYATKPDSLVDLLISPHRSKAAGPVASAIASRRAELGVGRERGHQANVAYLQGLVAARLDFAELLRVIVPMTAWWQDRRVVDVLRARAEEIQRAVETILRWARAKSADAKHAHAFDFGGFTAVDHYVALASLIYWAAEEARTSPGDDSADVGVGSAIDRLDDATPVVTLMRDLFGTIVGDPAVESPMIWQVSLNRRASLALEKSVPAVKGDAANSLFRVKCDQIGWAVLDSGIDAQHPAFALDEPHPMTGRTSRVAKSFDFTNIREIVSLDNLDTDTPDFEERLTRLLGTRAGDAKVRRLTTKHLKTLAGDADNDRPINWALVEPLIDVTDSKPFGGHGTHVAGIIGARGRSAPGSASVSNLSAADGMCPDINLYDFRVLGMTLQDTEFAIIAALQYIRYLNERHSYLTVHGANLSLSIPHDVRNFACGRTPVCDECQRLVDSGVVVVAAAGNLGFHSFETKDGSYEGYTAFSITDPGNADAVITVGATHRSWPHTYGVSFFSSRGPTGDGRMKPDLVAPGERIRSCLPDGGWGELDGTSMAAPHVSGAAAMLMGRYTELVGQPRRIKRILCESATDLERERSFQGHGMLDVLRAFQSI